MKGKFIRAYFMRVDRESGIPYQGYCGMIGNTLSAEQEYVNFDEPGGWIQVVPLNSDILVICHDEGKILHFPLNRAWVEDDGTVLDVCAGNIMAVRGTGEGFASIRESDIPYIEKCLLPVRLLDGKLIRVPDSEIPVFKKG